MKCSSRLPLIAIVSTVVIVPLAAGAAPKAYPDDPAGLTLRIYDYSDVPAAVLERAFEETENIYRKAGARARLIRCRTATTDPVLAASCGMVPGPSVIRVRILPERMAGRTHRDKRVFGFAMTAPDPQFGVIANVFYDRDGKLAADTDANEGVVLGHVIAHEAGHLLLGMESHSPRGLMHIPWREPEIFAAHTGALNFTRGQQRKIRRAVAARTLAGGAVGGPAAIVAAHQPSAAPGWGL